MTCNFRIGPTLRCNCMISFRFDCRGTVGGNWLYFNFMFQLLGINFILTWIKDSCYRRVNANPN